MTASPDISKGKLAIIAGGGTAPRQLIAACQKLGHDFYVVCLEGQADSGLAENLPHVWLPFGAGAKLKKLAEDEKFTHAVMIGRVRRPSLAEIKPDWLALKVLTKIGMNALGDDGLLRAIGKALEEESGVKVIGAHEIFTDLLAPRGNLTRAIADETAMVDIKRGIEITRALGALDVGQAAVVQQGIVLGLEAIEGTDALLKRCAGLKREGAGGVLVKCAKPQQDNRYDLPTIGPETVRAAHDAGLRGIAIEAGRSLMVERAQTIALADQLGLFILGLERIDG